MLASVCHYTLHIILTFIYVDNYYLQKERNKMSIRLSFVINNKMEFALLKIYFADKFLYKQND